LQSLGLSDRRQPLRAGGVETSGQAHDRSRLHEMVRRPVFKLRIAAGDDRQNRLHFTQWRTLTVTLNTLPKQKTKKRINDTKQPVRWFRITSKRNSSLRFIHCRSFSPTWFTMRSMANGSSQRTGVVCAQHDIQASSRFRCSGMIIPRSWRCSHTCVRLQMQSQNSASASRWQTHPIPSHPPKS